MRKLTNRKYKKMLEKKPICISDLIPLTVVKKNPLGFTVGTKILAVRLYDHNNQYEIIDIDGKHKYLHKSYFAS